MIPRGASSSTWFQAFSLVVRGTQKKLEMGQNAISTLKSLTNVHSVSGRPTLKDDHERTFRNESFQGLGEKSKQT